MPGKADSIRIGMHGGGEVIIKRVFYLVLIVAFGWMMYWSAFWSGFVFGKKNEYNVYFSQALQDMQILNHLRNCHYDRAKESAASAIDFSVLNAGFDHDIYSSKFDVAHFLSNSFYETPYMFFTADAYSAEQHGPEELVNKYNSLKERIKVSECASK
ncbi:hypothetical protein ISN76_10210 [Dyella halodurans]|uniref:Uncharacterized protein n=1 Tax=Dyella halodurans TaxID=1920171 RepID=A0ABV9C291_9GAMM|nr:hypothetical protein [Dyella halodurans]